MSNHFRKIGRRVAVTVTNGTGQSVVWNGFVRSTKRIAYINVQQQMSGNPPPLHEKRLLLPVFGALTMTNAYQNVLGTGMFLLTCYGIWGEPGLGNQGLEFAKRISEMEQQKIEMEQQKIEIEQEQEQREKESEKAREDNTHQMSFEWSSIDPSLEAVLNKTYKSNRFSILRKLLRWVKKSKPDKATRAPKSVGTIIHFFLRWKFHHDNKTIDSAHLKEYIGTEFDTFRDSLEEIRDDEARDWGGADVNKLNKVIDFLDEISKMEMDGSGES